MAQDGDTGVHARMTYSLEDDLEESSTFVIRTDPVTQEGVVLLAKVGTRTGPLGPEKLLSSICTMRERN